MERYECASSFLFARPFDYHDNTESEEQQPETKAMRAR